MFFPHIVATMVFVAVDLYSTMIHMSVGKIVIIKRLITD